MKACRTVMIILVVLSTLILSGFKKPAKTHKKIKQRAVAVEQQKQLDLAVPARSLSIQSAQLQLAPLSDEAAEAPQLFNLDRTRADSLEMKGQVIMSQEPEVEKRKSADGAGIMINIHP